ncbi:tetratricopeptide repeat protein [Lentzea sp. PSKA42]|uniref:Tetratricopeptide repeat protein n=1 Tax=Lentzea indica TaxID=2604800 RepID=A0ABX1FL21_9PSEU|nr:tetratricopeptide repeat protein [Lentzea indica]NKE59694.1 tetratricopeptide repeat protein [Lentzea indica]
MGIIAENLGFVESRRGDVPAALAHLDRAERIIAQHGGQLAPVLQDRAELLLSVGLVSEARDHASQAVTAFRDDGRRLKVPETRLLLADAALLASDWPPPVSTLTPRWPSSPGRVVIITPLWPGRRCSGRR